MTARNPLICAGNWLCSCKPISGLTAPVPNHVPATDAYQASKIERRMWPQSENVVFEQSRNVILTASTFGDAGRTTTDDSSRKRPAGGIEEGEKELDHAARGC